MGAAALAALRARLICSRTKKKHSDCCSGCGCVGQHRNRPCAISISNKIAPAPWRLYEGEAAAGSGMGEFFPSADPLSEFWGDAKTFGGKKKVVVVGHRGCGKNKIPSLGEAHDPRPSIRENTITSFNMAAANGADFVEFDVQVTKDGHPVIFHDDLLITDDKIARAISDLTLHEFLSIGFQKETQQQDKMLLRRASDGTLAQWTATVEDCLCTLKQAFQQVHPFVGFNIELKFDDVLNVSEDEVNRVVDAVISEVRDFGDGRKMYYSSFHPDAVAVLRSKQKTHPVFFLTDGGSRIYNDFRRNSIEAAIEVCKKNDLQGIVCEVKGILNNPSAVAQVKECGFDLLTYGELNNVGEAVHKEEEMGVDGVIVDHVMEMVNLARKLDNLYSEPSSEGGVEPSPVVKAVA